MATFCCLRDFWEVRPQAVQYICLCMLQKQRVGGGVTAAPLPSRQHQDSSDGIGFNVAAALVDVTAIDCTGSDLFDRMRL